MTRRSREELIAFLCLILAIRRDTVGRTFDETAAPYRFDDDPARITVAEADERIGAIRDELIWLGARGDDLAAFDRVVAHERDASRTDDPTSDDPIVWFRTLLDEMRGQVPEGGLTGTLRARRLDRVLSSLDALADLV